MREWSSNDFEVTEETPYGPVIKRRLLTVEEKSVPKPKTEIQSPGRRNFLKGALAVAATASVAGFLKEEMDDSNNKEQISEGRINPSESIERETDSANFENELSGYEALANLKKDEVIFVDESNRPVGRPQKLREFIDKKIRPDGSVIERYLYTPGEFNEAGILERGIPGEWLSYVQARVQASNPQRKVTRRFHVMEDFKKAYNETDEPELVSAIARDEVTNYLDIVKHFADKSVAGKGSFSRKEYLQKTITFKEWIPPAVANELRKILPGLCAQESKFNAGLTSSSGAKGIMQFMPATWKEYGGKLEEQDSFTKQVEIAGQFISDLYKQVQSHIGQETLQILQAQYSNEEQFQIDFLVPMMINSYNAGAARLGEAARLFVSENKSKRMPKGKDLFLAIANFAEASEGGKYLTGYDKESREYVTRIYAQAELLSKGV